VNLEKMDKTKDLIFTVFNLGVIARRERQFATIQAASNYFYDVIYNDLSRQYKGFMDDVLILSYADYLTSIALLGYILPYVCAYDEDFKNKLMNLILTKVRKPREISEFEELQKQKASAVK
jgi:hypothetical protein